MLASVYGHAGLVWAFAEAMQAKPARTKDTGVNNSYVIWTPDAPCALTLTSGWKIGLIAITASNIAMIVRMVLL